MKRTMIAGEGRHELGGCFDGAWDRDQVGLIEALLEKAGPGAWDICAAQTWKSIRKFKAGEHRQAETRNLLGLAMMAMENGIEVLAFSRDLDRLVDREEDVERGIAEAASLFPDIRVVGGVAIRTADACYGDGSIEPGTHWRIRAP